MKYTKPFIIESNMMSMTVRTQGDLDDLVNRIETEHEHTHLLTNCKFCFFAKGVPVFSAYTGDQTSDDTLAEYLEAT